MRRDRALSHLGHDAPTRAGKGEHCRMAKAASGTQHENGWSGMGHIGSFVFAGMRALWKDRHSYTIAYLLIAEIQ